jgi:RNA polymerase sigma-70 factor (ECF subfamily)
VLRTVYLVSRNLPQAQDVTQDAFVELLCNWDTVSRFERPGAWVRRVAIRKLLKLLRREARRREAERAVEAAPPLEPADVDVLRAVAGLSPRQRAAVVLYYYEDRPLEEVAELLGCSTSTAGVHIHRARARLGSLLEVTPDGR